jgi:hypothetical protein
MIRSIPQNDRWNGVITNLKAIDEKELTKERVARVLTERSMELKAKSKTTSTQNLTLAVGNYKNVVCYRCNQKGHISRNCTIQRDGERDRTRENERDGGRRDAEKLKPHRRFPAQKQEIIPNYTFHVGGSSGDSTWIRDSGAPRWYTWDKSVFVNFKPMDGKEEYCHGVKGDGAKIEGPIERLQDQNYMAGSVLRPNFQGKHYFNSGDLVEGDKRAG